MGNQNKLQKAFNTLLDTMIKYDLFQEGDEVDIDLGILQETIDEVSKRLIVIEEVTEDISKSIKGYETMVDSGTPVILTVTDYDCIMIGANDVLILTDLDDTLPIDDNWNNLFQLKEKTIEEKLTDFYNELDNNNTSFEYDDRMGTCHINTNDSKYSYDCTPFWENAKGISVCLNENYEPICPYIIPCDKPTNDSELDYFKSFYKLHVNLMINSLFITN